MSFFPEPDVPPADEGGSLAAGARALSDLAARERFLQALSTSLADGTARRLVLSKPCDSSEDLERVIGRPLHLRGQDCVSFVYRHPTRDVTRNEPLAEACRTVAALLGTRFAHAHLTTAETQLQLMASRKGHYTLHAQRAASAGMPAASAPQAHDRQKQRWVAQDAPFLVSLGVTDEQHAIVPAMARKWKQINKFVEVVAHALDDARLGPEAPLHVIDFGAGKGYLTFALYDWLRRRQAEGDPLPRVIGVELRPELVRQANDAAERCGFEGLRFEAGDIATRVPQRLDVMIALHACDTATDHALAAAIRAQASVIVCSPCCHKQLRPLMQTPQALRGLLQHGIHLGQEAEMLTDALRALILQAQGYDAQVFEFVSLEHTSKNKMILAVRRRPDADTPRRREEARAQAAQLMGFYGVREHCLQTLLQAHGADPATA